jgi:Domain of unknown function (DUF4407)
MTGPVRRIGNTLAVLAGAHPDVLEAAPRARARFVALGGVLLSTGALAVLSASFAVHMALGASWPVALLIGLGWGAVIVNLDRMLLVGMAHDPSLRRNVVLAVPRIGLALVLGAVIATPLTLRVFGPEIDTEVVSIQAEAADAYKAGLESDSRFRQLPALRERIAAHQAVVASGGHADPALEPVNDRLATEQAAYDKAVSSYQQLAAKAQCEMDGTCGTGDAGDGGAYQSAKAAAEAQAAVVTAAKARFDAAVTAAEGAGARSAAQAQAGLAADEATLAGLTAEQDRLQAAFEATNDNADGILIRLQALSRLSDRDSTLQMAHLMLSLLFVCIELLPVLMKVLLNFAPPSAYDQVAALRDHDDVEAMRLQQKVRLGVEQAQAELLLMAESERVETRRQGILARQHAAEAVKAAQEREAAEAAEARRVERQKQVILARQQAAEARRAAEARDAAEAREAAEVRRAAEARKAAEARRAAEAREAAEARRAAEALEAARAELEAARLELEQQAARDAAAEGSARWPWDMDPFGFARDAAVRTVRTVTRRTSNRVPTSV